MGMTLTQRVALGVALAGGAVGAFTPVSDDLMEHITIFEKRALIPYRDPVGIWTVCSGLTNADIPGFVKPGKHYTVQECKAAERRHGEAVAAALSVQLPYVRQGMWDALMDFGWNTGVPKLARSTLIRKLKSGDCYGAASEFQRWVYAGGRKLPGLVVRRGWEHQRFVAECGPWLRDRTLPGHS